MSLEWYSFEDSYLLAIDYRQMAAILIVDIDARMSIDHPRIQKQGGNEDFFSRIKLIFEGVQYYRAITSLHIKHDPNEDIGSIESVRIIDPYLASREFSVEQDGVRLKLSMGLTGNNKATIYSKSGGIKILEFVSEKIAFQVGYEGLKISEQR